MKKILLILIISLVFLVSCNDNTNSGKQQNTSASSEKQQPQYKDGILKLDPEAVSRMLIKNIYEKSESEYTNPTMISELVSFLKKQSYSKPREKWDESYRVELFDNSRKPVLEITFGARAVTFNKDVSLGKTVIKKGVYEVEMWVSDFMRELSRGSVLDPEHMQYPAKLKIPDDSYSLERYYKGSNKIDSYDTEVQLYRFIGSHFINKGFEIVESHKLYTDKEKEAELLKIRGESRYITVNYSNSETYLELNSMNQYREIAKGYCLVLSKVGKQPGIYKLIADNMILIIKADTDFDNSFNAVFKVNSAEKEVTPDEIEKLFNENKPNYLEYITRNLGIDDWTTRLPDKLERKQMKLDSNSSPYTVLSLSSPFNVRLLIFKQNRDTSWKFIDCIGFGGHVAGIDYSLKKYGDNTFIVGNECRGYGTGTGLYYQTWYTVTDKGKKKVLSLPYDEYSEAPFGGFTTKADDISVKNSYKTKVAVSYQFTKWYVLDIDIADENGRVEVTGAENVIFEWDEGKKLFTSRYTPDENGVTSIPCWSDAINKKCDYLLKKHYNRLLESIKNIPLEKNEFTREFKAYGIREFLKDCSDCDKKAELQKAVDDLLQ